MRIALLEDDPDQSELIAAWLTEAGHRVFVYETSRGFLRETLRESFDVFVLDWMLPDISGLEALKELRGTQGNDRPVLFVTSKGDETNVVRALENGADDYMTKPVRRRELLARLNAVSRRIGARMADAGVIEASPYTIDTQRRVLQIDGDPIKLTDREFDLAVFLFHRAGTVVSRNHLLQSVWGHSGAVNTRTVDTHVSRLRKKLRLTPAAGWRLTSVYQHGYRLETMDSDEMKDVQSYD